MYLTPKEVAALTGRTKITILSWIKKGKLPAEKEVFPKSGRVRYYIAETDIPVFLRKENHRVEKT